MEIHIDSDLDQQRYRDSIETVTERFEGLPEPLIFLVYTEPGHPDRVIGDTAVEPRSRLDEACNKDTSASFTVDELDIITLYVDEPFLVDNDDALIGLITHEVIHAVHRKRGLEQEIEDQATEYSDMLLENLAEFDVSKEEAISFIRDVVSNAVFCLKDIYANTEIIEHGFGDELAEYYYHQLGIDSFCPLPRFYQDETTIKQVQDAVSFELQLTPAWLPFEKHQSERAQELQEQIEECYELNIPETADAIHSICDIYTKSFDDEDFIEQFYTGLFDEIFELIENKLA